MKKCAGIGGMTQECPTCLGLGRLPDDWIEPLEPSYEFKKPTEATIDATIGQTLKEIVTKLPTDKTAEHSARMKAIWAKRKAEKESKEKVNA